MALVAPSIISADFLNLEKEIKLVEEAGVDLLHIDVMDGMFVPNITIGYEAIHSIKKITKLPLEAHLMIEKPERYIKDFAIAGADTITIHYEASVHLHRTIQLIKEMKKKTGVSLNPATSICLLEDIINEIDMVLIMSVNPGFSGQKFIPESLEKIRKLKKLIKEKGSSAKIEVDGGIKIENVKKVVDAGADIIVMGSGFFSAKDYKELMIKLREKIGTNRKV